MDVGYHCVNILIQKITGLIILILIRDKQNILFNKTLQTKDTKMKNKYNDIPAINNSLSKILKNKKKLASRVPTNIF